MIFDNVVSMIFDNVYVQMVIGHFHLILGKGGTEMVIQGVSDGEKIGWCHPAENAVFNRIGTVISQLNRWCGVGKDVVSHGDSFIAGFFNGIGRGVIGGGNFHGNAASAEGGVIDNTGFGKFFIGDENVLTVNVEQFGIVKSHAGDHTDCTMSPIANGCAEIKTTLPARLPRISSAASVIPRENTDSSATKDEVLIPSC